MGIESIVPGVIPWSDATKKKKPVGVDQYGRPRHPPTRKCKCCGDVFEGWGNICLSPECEKWEAARLGASRYRSQVKQDEKIRLKKLAEVQKTGLICNNPICKRRHPRGQSVKGSCCQSCFEIVTKHQGVLR